MQRASVRMAAFTQASLAACLAAAPAVASESGQAPPGKPRLAPGRPGAATYAAVVLARPLFARNRRPLVKDDAQVAGKAEMLPRLSGIVTAASFRRAIFDGNGRPRAYAEGDQLGRYTILAIGRQHVTVLGPDGQQDIGLSFDASRPVSAGTPKPLGPSILDRLNSHAQPRAVMPKMPSWENFVAHMPKPPPQ